MNVFLTSCDLHLGLNPMVARTILAIPGIKIQTTITPNTDAIFLSWIASPDLFHQDAPLIRAIVDSKKPVIIFDHQETANENQLLGWDHPLDNSYANLHAAASMMNVVAYFKREFISGKPFTWGTPKFPVHPLDWVLQTNGERHIPVWRETFEARPIDVFYSWGYSSESRPKLMGELLKQAGRFCSHFCLTEEDLDRALKEKRERIFALLHVPHFRRIHIAKIMEWQQQAKVSISMFGAGKKCFRHAEASYNCVMAHQSPEQVIWSYQWKNGNNCIGLWHDEGCSVEDLWKHLRVHQGALYDIYIAGVKNNENYHADNYGRHYLLPKIKEALK